jgi:hypothetical protein
MPGSVEADETRDQADTAFDNQDWDGAKSLYQRYLADAAHDTSQDSNIHWQIALCHLQNGDEQPAIDEFRAGNWAPAQYADLLDSGGSGDTDGDESGDGGGTQESDDPVYDQAFEVACDAYASGNYDGAAQRFEQLLNTSSATDDQKHEIRWNLGMCHFHLGHLDRAVEQFTQGGYQEADYLPILQEARSRQKIDAANTAFDSGNFQDAVALFGELSRDQNLPAEDRKQVQWQLGLANFHMGDNDQGRQAMEAGGFSEADYHEAYEAASAGR